MTPVRVCPKHRKPLRVDGDALVCSTCGEVTRWLVWDGRRDVLVGERDPRQATPQPDGQEMRRRLADPDVRRRMAESQRARRARERSGNISR